ncbi:hypothetical protein ACHZ97_12125 [Lysobacter soli]|uniref:hypothetical protein n=1 Tax=Lysobacter soli TaxID=453783 RepID=UPI0037CC27F7
MKLAIDVFEGRFPATVKNAHSASGAALASIFEPRQYWKIDYEELIARLASTRAGSAEVSIYGRAFGVWKPHLSCDELEKLLGRLSFALPWGEISKDSALQRALGTSNKAATEHALRARMGRLLELRNNLAHSQGAEVVTYEQLMEFFELYENFCRALSDQFLAYIASKR